MNIINLIPEGRENAITRANLAVAMSLPDRTVRDIVREERSKWTPIQPFICSDSSERGYWLTCDITEIRTFRNWYASYAESGGFVLNNIDRGLAKLDGTGIVYVRAHYRRVSGRL